MKIVKNLISKQRTKSVFNSGLHFFLGPSVNSLLIAEEEENVWRWERKNMETRESDLYGVEMHFLLQQMH